MLKVEHLNSGYGKKQVLFDVSFEIEKGDITLLIGSNGSGKSTLLKTIFGVNKVWSGTVFFEGENITNAKPNILLQKGVMYVPQKNNVFEQLTVKENLEISGLALKSNKLFKDRFAEVIDLFPTLVSFLNQHPMKMSGGERQLLVLAMAMLHQPKLLLLDEPFTGLSPKIIEQIKNIITVINKKTFTTILMVEHRIKEAMPLASNLIGLKLGTIIENVKAPNQFEEESIQKILI
jgi:branched-chain amino acid transport system ATP-binding protein